MKRSTSAIRHSCFGLAIVSLVLAACGVQEHPHEQPAETSAGGSIFKPPTNGGTVNSNGGALNTTGGFGVPSYGGASNAGNSSGGASFITGGSTSAGTGNGGAAGPQGGGATARGGAMGFGGAAAGGAPPVTSGGRSGATVDINGAVLPKEDVVAFVHIGHSNMLGYGTSPNASRAYHLSEMNLRAWMYRKNAWSPALERTAGTGNFQAGPGTSLLKQALDLAPTRYFVSLGYGVGSAYCSQFKRGGLYYNEFMAAPLALKGKVTFGAILIMLGITERHGTDQDIANFPTCINEVATAIRTDLAEPNLPVLVCDYEMGATGELSPTAEFGTKMVPKIREVPAAVANSAIVPTDGLGMQDDHHFNLDGQKEWSKRALTIMKEKGWFPW